MLLLTACRQVPVVRSGLGRTAIAPTKSLHMGLTWHVLADLNCCLLWQRQVYPVSFPEADVTSQEYLQENRGVGSPQADVYPSCRLSTHQQIQNLD